MTNREKITLVIACGIELILLLALIFVLIIQEPDAEEIYKNNLQSVVELKASSEYVGDSYGTAVFIDKEGTLVTNAHVVTYKKLDITYEFDNLSIRLAAEGNYREVELVKFDENLDKPGDTPGFSCVFIKTRYNGNILDVAFSYVKDISGEQKRYLREKA